MVLVGAVEGCDVVMAVDAAGSLTVTDTRDSVVAFSDWYESMLMVSPRDGEFWHAVSRVTITMNVPENLKNFFMLIDWNYLRGQFDIWANCSKVCVPSTASWPGIFHVG